MHIRRLNPDDASSFSALRSRALREEPMSFSSNEAEHAAISLDLVRQRLAPSLDSFVLGAFDREGKLAGVVGVYRQAPAKHSHKAFMWGMYVSPAFRRRGIGRQLVESAIAGAATLPGVEVLCTSVFLTAVAAHSLYPSCGFTTWGVQPRSAKIGSEYVAEEHFYLELRG